MRSMTLSRCNDLLLIYPQVCLRHLDTTEKQGLQGLMGNTLLKRPSNFNPSKAQLVQLRTSFDLSSFFFKTDCVAEHIIS